MHRQDQEPVKFKCTSQGIYAYTIPVCYEKKMELAESHLVDTVKENHRGYTQVQFDRAVKAWSLYHELGAPTLENYKGFIKMGGVQNCPSGLRTLILHKIYLVQIWPLSKEKVLVKNQRQSLKIGLNCQEKFWRSTVKLNCVLMLCTSMVWVL